MTTRPYTTLASTDILAHLRGGGTVRADDDGTITYGGRLYSRGDLDAILDEPDRRSVAVGADEVAAARRLAAEGRVRLLPGGRVPLRVGYEVLP